jgi:hypothetical protein
MKESSCTSPWNPRELLWCIKTVQQIPSTCDPIHIAHQITEVQITLLNMAFQFGKNHLPGVSNLPNCSSHWFSMQQAGI